MIVSRVADPPCNDQRNVASNRSVFEHGTAQCLHGFLVVHSKKRIAVDADKLVVDAESRVLRRCTALYDNKVIARRLKHATLHLAMTVRQSVSRSVIFLKYRRFHHFHWVLSACCSRGEVFPVDAITPPQALSLKYAGTGEPSDSIHIFGLPPPAVSPTILCCVLPVLY